MIRAARKDPRRRVLAFLAFGCLACAGQPAPTPPAPPRHTAAPATIQQARERLLAFQERHKIPGLSVAVAKVGPADPVVWFEAFGVSDLESRAPVTRESVFPIGSTSKTLASIALGILVEEGKLDLDVPIQAYVTYFPEKPFPISARQIAGHLSGLRNYDMAKGEYTNSRAFASVREAVAVFADDPLLFEPGTRYAYSAYNYVLLSAAIEGASGTDFLNFVETRILLPLRLVRTGPNRGTIDGLVTSHLAGFYGQPARAGAVDVSNKWAAGGFVSTPSEMARFGGAVLAGKLVRRETLNLLSTPLTLNDGSDSGAGYGLGWRSGVRKLPLSGREARIVHHGGTAHGAMSFLVLLPESGWVVALQSNLLFEPFEPFYLQALEIADLFSPPGDDPA